MITSALLPSVLEADWEAGLRTGKVSWMSVAMGAMLDDTGEGVM